MLRLKTHLYLVVFNIFISLSIPSYANGLAELLDKYRKDHPVEWKKLLLQSKNGDLPSIESNLDLMLCMEKRLNLLSFRQDLQVGVEQMVSYPASDVQLHLSPDFPQKVRELFIKSSAVGQDSSVFFPVHPNNTDMRVPGMEVIGLLRKADKAAKADDDQSDDDTSDDDSKEDSGQMGGKDLDLAALDLATVDELRKRVTTIPIHHTASRSKILTLGGMPPFSIKSGTDFIKANSTKQPTKVDMVLDGTCSRERTDYIDAIDKMLGKDFFLILLREIGFVQLKSSKQGFTIRDLSPLNDGMLYVPAFSLTKIGPLLAQLKGQDFGKFIEENYVKGVGKAMAKLLLRYGLQMDSPHSQNLLLRFDNDLNFQGVVIRDIADTEFVKPIIEAINPDQEAYVKERETHGHIADSIDPRFTHTTWRFDQETNIPFEKLKYWSYLQAQAYVDEINEALGTQHVLPEFIDSGSGADPNGDRVSQSLNEFLQDPKTLKKISAYNKKLSGAQD